MKKRYLFMSSFFIIGTVFTLIYFLSYRSYDRGQEEVVKQDTHPVDTVKEIRVNSSMKYVVENYDGTTGVVTKEEGTVPAKIAGKTREELENYIIEYNQKLQEAAIPEAPDSVELISFSKDKVVIRENYLGAEEETGFYIKLQDQEVVIFHNDQVTPYEYTGIQEEVLPESELEKLREGFFVEDERELYSVLENLSS